jgi:PAS domain S-box-containing protein
MALLDIEAGFWALRRQIKALAGDRLTDSVLQQAGANGGASFAAAFTSQSPAADAPQLLRECIGAYQAAGFGKFDIERLEWPLGRVLIRGEDTFEAWMMAQHNQDPRSPACAYAAGVLVGFVNVLAGRNDVVCIERTCQAQGAAACLFELLPTAAAGDVPAVALSPDPALGRQLSLLETIFDRMPMGIVILDTGLRVRRFNPTWAGFVTRYTSLPATQVVPGANLYDLIPGNKATLEPIFHRVLAGETVRQAAFPLQVGEFISYWDAVISPLVEDGRVMSILHVITDATERVQAEHALRESQRALSTLISNLPGIAYRCRNDANWTMEFVSEGSLALTGYGPAELMGADRTITYGDLIQPADKSLVWEAVQSALDEYRPFEIKYRLLTPQSTKWVWERGQGIYNELGEVVALEGFITDISERVMAEQTLEQRVQQRTQEIERRRQVAEGLQDILAVLNSNQSLDEILDYITCQAKRLLETEAVAIYRLQEEQGLLEIEAAYGLSEEYIHNIKLPLGQGALGRAVLQKEPVVVPDVRAVFADHSAPSMANDVVFVDAELRHLLMQMVDRYGAVVGVPIVVKDQVYGGLALYYPQPRDFFKEEIGLATTLADHVALAIENARLLDQVEQTAVMEERQRLARELHDSVSQALYGIGLGIRTARTLLDRESLSEAVKAKLTQPLDYVLSLADAGLAEMRALIFELRPDALAEQGLVAALERQAKALQARHKLNVETDFCQEPDLPLTAKECLYRVTQEALNNVIKHAQAGHVQVRLHETEGKITLEIADDGLGFEPQQEYPGHMGLQSMRERVTKVQGLLAVKSEPGAGTSIKVWVPVQHKAEASGE